MNLTEKEHHMSVPDAAKADDVQPDPVAQAAISMTASWDRTMRAIERAAQAIEHAANRWEEKAGEV
jgi:hypothetical protein